MIAYVMPTNGLSDAMCGTLKRPGKPKLSDSGWPPPLRNAPLAAATGEWRIGSTASKKQLSFGPHPAVSLKDARERRDEAKSQLAAGVDPSEVRNQSTALATVSERSKVFRAVVTSYLEKMQAEGRAEAGHRQQGPLAARGLPRLIPRLAIERSTDIKPAEVLEFRKQVEARGTFENRPPPAWGVQPSVSLCGEHSES